jgi:nucleoid-associated protein YgaU
LWRITERDLIQQGRPASDAAVARAWPAWWSANRAVVGDDPHLIRPGMHLRPPTAGTAPDH